MNGAPALLVLATIIVSGCAAPQPKAQPEPKVQPQRSAEPAPSADASAIPLIQRDPSAYLQQVAHKCATLEQYTVVFTRQERRGLGPLKSLHEPELIQCWFRRSPLSVRMKWLDPDIKYGESTYVAGQEGNKIRFVPKHGLLGLKPGLVRVNPTTPLKWGESRYPVETFGVEKLVEETLDALRQFPDARITYQGLTEAPFVRRIAHKLRIDYPPEENPTPTQELYFDVQTDLPVATVVTFPDGSIDTAYAYDKLDASVHLTDDDFLLDAERIPNSPSQPGADAGPRPQTRTSTSSDRSESER